MRQDEAHFSSSGGVSDREQWGCRCTLQLFLFFYYYYFRFLRYNYLLFYNLLWLANALNGANPSA